MDQMECFNSLPERVRQKIEINAETGCWNWTACKDKDGYGKVGISGNRNVRAHRFVFDLTRGEIDKSLVIDHLCRNRGCVNPFHLELVSHKENTLRGISFSAVNAAKTTCANGHALTDENTYMRPNGNRDCRICIRNRVAAYDKRRKEKAA